MGLLGCIKGVGVVFPFFGLVFITWVCMCGVGVYVCTVDCSCVRNFRDVASRTQNNAFTVHVLIRTAKITRDTSFLVELLGVSVCLL